MPFATLPALWRICWMCLLLLGGAIQAAPLALDARQQAVELSPHLAWYETTSPDLSVQAIARDLAQGRFHPPQGRVPNFGFSSSSYWFHVALHNTGASASEWLLESGYPTLDYVDVYLLHANGRIDHMAGGDRVPFSTREIPHPHQLFRLALAPDERVDVLLRVSSQGPIQVPLTLWQPEAFWLDSANIDAGQWMFFGTLLTMLFYYLVIYFSVWDRGFFYYVLCVGCYFIQNFSIQGYAFQYFWPDSPWWANQVVPISSSLGLAAIIQFSCHFLSLARWLPRVDRVLRMLMWLAVADACVSLFASYMLVMHIELILALMTLPLLCFSGIYVFWIAHQRYAQFYMLAWPVLLLGGAVYVLKALGVLPFNPYTNHALELATGLDVLFLAFALAHRLKLLREERERIQREANEQLEERVRQRTAELNSTLDELACARDIAVNARSIAEAELKDYQSHLEQLIDDRTRELAATNKELEAFSYTVSHDLRAPLRAINGFASVLVEDHAEQLVPEARGLVDRIVAASRRMGELIDALLSFHRLAREDLQREPVDLSTMAIELLEEMRLLYPGRSIGWQVTPGLSATGDRRLIRNVLQNLLGNALKFTGSQPLAQIEVGRGRDRQQEAFFVRDNGEGFDAAAAAKLFGAFQRFHRRDQFDGTGIGLASVQRVIHRHGGEIWAESQPGQGATFWFTLPAAA